VGCNLHTQAEHGPVALTGPSTSVSFQRPRSFELVGGKGFEPNRPLGENGVTARQRTIRSYHPSGDSAWIRPPSASEEKSLGFALAKPRVNPDPRALEARMLPLHHAAFVVLHPGHVEDTPSLQPGPCSLMGLRPQQKRPSRGSPQKAWFSMNADLLGRFALLPAIERAAMVIDPHLFGGSRHADDGS